MKWLMNESDIIDYAFNSIEKVKEDIKKGYKNKIAYSTGVCCKDIRNVDGFGVSLEIVKDEDNSIRIEFKQVRNFKWYDNHEIKDEYFKDILPLPIEDNYNRKDIIRYIHKLFS